MNFDPPGRYRRGMAFPTRRRPAESMRPTVVTLHVGLHTQRTNAVAIINVQQSPGRFPGVLKWFARKYTRRRGDVSRWSRGKLARRTRTEEGVITFVNRWHTYGGENFFLRTGAGGGKRKTVGVRGPKRLWNTLTSVVHSLSVLGSRKPGHLSLPGPVLKKKILFFFTYSL